MTNDNAPIEWPKSHVVNVRKVPPGQGAKSRIWSKFEQSHLVRVQLLILSLPFICMLARTCCHLAFDYGQQHRHTDKHRPNDRAINV